MTWHVPESSLRAYVDGRGSDVDAWSVESHLIVCEACRRRVVTAAAGTETATIVDAARAAMPAELPPPGRVRRAGRLRSVVALAASGPAARRAWLIATACVLAMSTVLELSGARLGDAGGADGVPWLTLLAPVLPVAGVAAAFDSGLDDAGEIIASTPAGGLRLLLARTLGVLIGTAPAALAVGVAFTRESPAGWLLPALALTALTLALGSATGMPSAAAAVGSGWVVLVAGPVVADVGRSLVPPADVGVWLPAAGLSVAVLVLRSGAFARRPLALRPRNEA